MNPEVGVSFAQVQQVVRFRGEVLAELFQQRDRGPSVLGEAFRGKSKNGAYEDWGDWSVGKEWTLEPPKVSGPSGFGLFAASTDGRTGRVHTDAGGGTVGEGGEVAAGAAGAGCTRRRTTR